MTREGDGAKDLPKEGTETRETDANYLAQLVDLGIALSAEQGREELNQKILMAARKFTNADGGSLYLVNKDESELHFRILMNDTLNTFFVSGRENEKPFPPLPLYDVEGRPNYRNIATYVALTGKPINIEDAYCADGFDFSGTRAFDAKTGYRSKSFLTVPLKSTRGAMMGVLQLINARDEAGQVIAFDKSIEPIIAALASQAAVAIENSRLLVAQRDLMESFVRVLGHAIDAKSPHTADHCSRVPVIARMLAQAAVDDKLGPFSNFYLTDMEWYELDLAAWLHDCGKIVTPDHVMEKATKLETIHNRIHEIRTRFEVLRRDAEIDMLKRKLAGEDADACDADFKQKVAKLENQFAMVADANIGDTELDTDTIYALHDIAELTWVRHFDRTVGLSWSENQRLTDADLVSLREAGTETLLMDREDQVYLGFNRGELYNLSIPHGTLTSEERQVINDHVVVTQDMLAQLPYPRELQRIPAIAGNHHEKMDGSGYPHGITGDDMGILEKVMVIADIFEALTAVDRPYKRPKLLSECISILGDMRDKGQIDNDLFELFLVSGTYLEYGKKFLKSGQCDEVDIEQFIISR
ncbi:GAF and HD-GYP domain-containing protein [Thalassospira lucentensis]|uniref:GAF and HD-GYP domain-containing protein n=1 Tax=Thalassospira lucentensis TaxID=168935 RepID=UPI0003B7A0AB|nr:HD domain-containing phosphohydrolase [Thalassospira lucentensis]RCK23408.1 diguanylate cyclase [Thalassospira lucentensis MCCC 1A00383 = DSM 14000]